MQFVQLPLLLLVATLFIDNIFLVLFRLAEDYPDCLMLNFTIKLISDAGHQAEITSISTAAQQIEVFSR